MKILYHHRTRATDAQRVHILEMVRAFRALGHDVVIASLANTEEESGSAEREAEEAWPKKLVRAVPLGYELMQLGYNLIGFPWLLSKILRGQIDFIYERYSLLNFCGVLAARMSGTPIVLEVNSPLALEQHRGGEIRAFRFARWVERAICNAATKVIVVTGPLRRLLLENGARASKLVVMPNGANPHHLRETRGADMLRKSLRLDGQVVIGFVGWFRSWHGLDFLIEVFANSDLAARGAKLLLIGDGPAMPELKALVARRKVQDSVVFTGPVTHEAIPPYLELIDIAVQPAANQYCCPMKILEYMAMGKPIVAPKQENIEELLTDGQQALLFAPGDADGLYRALARLADDGPARADLGRSAMRAIYDRGLLWSANAERVIRWLSVNPEDRAPAAEELARGARG